MHIFKINLYRKDMGELNEGKNFVLNVHDKTISNSCVKYFVNDVQINSLLEGEMIIHHNCVIMISSEEY